MKYSSFLKIFLSHPSHAKQSNILSWCTIGILMHSACVVTCEIYIFHGRPFQIDCMYVCMYVECITTHTDIYTLYATNWGITSMYLSILLKMPPPQYWTFFMSFSNRVRTCLTWYSSTLEWLPRKRTNNSSQQDRVLSVYETDFID